MSLNEWALTLFRKVPTGTISDIPNSARQYTILPDFVGDVASFDKAHASGSSMLRKPYEPKGRITQFTESISFDGNHWHYAFGTNLFNENEDFHNSFYEVGAVSHTGEMPKTLPILEGAGFRGPERIKDSFITSPLGIRRQPVSFSTNDTLNNLGTMELKKMLPEDVYAALENAHAAQKPIVVAARSSKDMYTTNYPVKKWQVDEIATALLQGEPAKVLPAGAIVTDTAQEAKGWLSRVGETISENKGIAFATAAVAIGVISYSLYRHTSKQRTEEASHSRG